MRTCVKTCTACREEKPLTAFQYSMTTRNGLRFKSRCQPCLNEYQRQWNKSSGKSRGYQIRHNYGIEEADVLALYEAQNGLCALCDVPIALKGNGSHIDHCHTTGRVRGLLCNNCNTGLGKFRDDPARLRRAADYLEG